VLGALGWFRVRFLYQFPQPSFEALGEPGLVSRGSRVLFDISNVNAKVVELAVRVLESRLPQCFDRPSLERVYVRALRSGSWWRAPGEARGVLWLLGLALKSSSHLGLS
jgi:hypothetical protein